MLFFQALKICSNLVITVFLPCLVGSSLAKGLTAEKLTSAWASTLCHTRALGFRCTVLCASGWLSTVTQYPPHTTLRGSEWLRMRGGEWLRMSVDPV